MKPRTEITVFDTLKDAEAAMKLGLAATMAERERCAKVCRDLAEEGKDFSNVRAWLEVAVDKIREGK